MCPALPVTVFYVVPNGAAVLFQPLLVSSKSLKPFSSGTYLNPAASTHTLPSSARIVGPPSGRAR